MEERNKEMTRRVLEEGFGKGDLSVVDEAIAAESVDHQEVPGTNFAEHLKQVIVTMRRAFPHPHFEIHDLLAEDDVVAAHSTMTGTHEGLFEVGPSARSGLLQTEPSARLEPSGRTIAVRHMHFIKFDREGRSTDLWHLMDTPTLVRQLGGEARQEAVPR